MKLNIYSVIDSVAGIYSQPFVMLNEPVAVRVMQNAVNSEGHNYNMNPEDYALYKIAEFDDVTGEFKSELTKVVDLITLVKKDKEEDK